MFHIICPNTAIDVRIQLDKFVHGQVQRATDSKGFASGKGVNSAFTSDFLGTKARLHAMVGTLDKDYFNTCAFTNTKVLLATLPGETRRNITIVDGSGLVAHIQTTGFVVTNKRVLEFIDDVGRQVNLNDIVLISGSLPEGFLSEHLYALIKLGKTKGATIVLDTDLYRIDGNEGVDIDFVKPNIEELNAYLGKHSIADVNEVFEKLRSHGVKHTIVTCGSQGAYLFNNTNQSTLFAQSTFDKQGDEAIGSGDAFIGAFAASLAEKEDHADALLKATAAGHSNIYHEGPGRIGETFLDIKKDCKVAKINRSVAIDQLTKLLDE